MLTFHFATWRPTALIYRGPPRTVHVHKSIVGTPGYVAPEVLIAKNYGTPCDVWRRCNALLSQPN